MRIVFPLIQLPAMHVVFPPSSTFRRRCADLILPQTTSCGPATKMTVEMATGETDNKQLEIDKGVVDGGLESLLGGGQNSADKARTLVGLLEGASLEHSNALLQLDFDDEGSNSDDDVDYMEDYWTFLVQEGDDALGKREGELSPVKHDIPVIPGEMHRMRDIDYATPEIHHHRHDGMVTEDFPGAPSLMGEAPVPAASEAALEEEDWDETVKKRSKKKRKAVDWEVEVEDQTPTKQEPMSSTSVLLPGDVPLPEDIPLPEDTRPSTPDENRAPAIAEELQLLPHTALEDEWAIPDTGSKMSKKEKKKMKASKFNLEDDLPHKEIAVIQAMHPVPASDPSRFDGRRDDRPRRRYGISGGDAMGGDGMGGDGMGGDGMGGDGMGGDGMGGDGMGGEIAAERTTRARMGEVARIPQTFHSPDGSKRPEGFGSHKTYPNRDDLIFFDRFGLEKAPAAAAPLGVLKSSAPPRQAKSRGLLGRLRLSAWNLSKRLVQALETNDQYDEEELEDDLAFGDMDYGEKKGPTPGAREIPKSPPTGPLLNFMVLPPTDFPPPLRNTYPPRRRRRPRPPGEFETLLRNKIFKPGVELTTVLTRPPWTEALPTHPPPLFTKASLTWRDLRPLGQFVAERDRTLREDLKGVELGVGAGAGGFNLDFNSKGILALLKPVQWINLWRSYDKRRLHVSSHVLDRLAEPKNVALDKDNEKPPLVTRTANPEHPEEREHRLLHEIEHELISSVKYQFGQSSYITVITYSEGSNGGDRVDSGAIALFKASAFAPGTGGAQATKLDLEARFEDIPGPICRILAREKNPNRFEVKRNGRSLNVKERGKVAPPRPGIVRVVKRETKGARQVQEQGKEMEGEWERIGGGWRRALHILLDHSDKSREATGGGDDEDEEDDCPNEGLIATIPQMLALLHLRYRAVDSIPSTSVFTFSRPLRCDEMSAYVRRGAKLRGPPVGATHVGSTGTVAVLFSKESQWVREQLFWA